jgi:hypothetical protein
MTALRIMLATVATASMAWDFVFLGLLLPRLMGVFKDMEVTGFPATMTAAMHISNFLLTKLFLTVPIAAAIAAWLLYWAISRSVSDRASLGASLIVAIVFIVGGQVLFYSAFGAMASLIQALMNQG